MSIDKNTSARLQALAAAIPSIEQSKMSVDRNTPARSQALAAAMSSIEKSCGKGAIMFLNQLAVDVIGAVSTGSIGLDWAIGVGGLPRGRIIEIYGPESSGKTTVALHTIAEAQKAGGKCAFIDAEHALDAAYAQKLGVDIDNLIVSQPDYGEQALEITETLVSSGALDVIVIDSVAALTPKAEIDGEMIDNQIGLQARLLSKALRKLTALVSKTNTIVIFINQLRMKIGVMFGNPETTTGGVALKFYSSVRIEIRRGSAIKDKDNNIVGNNTRAKIVKNKVAPPFKEVEFDIIYNEGISRSGEIIELGGKFNILEKSGAYYSYNGNRLGQGKENAKSFLGSNPSTSAEIESKIRSALFSGNGRPPNATITENEEEEEMATL